MKRFLVAAILCLIFTATGRAQQNAADAPASKEDVERYLAAVHSHEMVQKMVDAMSQPMHQMVHDQYMKFKGVLPADYEANMNQMMDEMMKEMPFDEIIQAMIPAYQKHFTKGDMDALIAFYSTSTGQKVLREMPAILSESMNATMPMVQQHVEAMTERLQQQIAETLKRSQSKVGEAAPASN
jgi:uncharacterized protein